MTAIDYDARISDVENNRVIKTKDVLRALRIARAGEACEAALQHARLHIHAATRMLSPEMTDVGESTKLEDAAIAAMRAAKGE